MKNVINRAIMAKKKMIFSLMLAIVSSLWMTSKALCQVDGCTCLFDDPPVAISGILQLVPFPCRESTEDNPCPPCLTIALNTNEQLYYLNGMNDNLNALLDTLVYPVNATVTGNVYTAHEDDGLAIRVLDISLHASLPSLCDEWNVLHEPFSCDGIYCRLQTLIYRLTTDTLIQDVNYVKLMEQEGAYTHYIGAMREGTNRDIYYVPADSTHEYLLYAFNAQVGDTLSNLWVGGFGRDYQGVVQAISNGSPRIFTIGVKFGDESDDYLYPIRWIEGVSSPETPMGMAVVPVVPADIGVYTLLCAYKDGEQVYSSSKSERYGCEFNGIPSTKPYSLCDTWNVMEVSLATSPDEVYHTVTQRLTKDTIIAYPRYYNFTPYARLEENGKYKGAMREGESGVIYYIPAGSAHEYLLYNFNAKVGDRLTNLWYGGDPEWCPNGYNATVLSISDETPRVFTIEVEYILSDSDGEHIEPWLIYWTEGVGLSDGPAGQFCPGPDCACSCGQLVLCAYKNGEQVYVSDMGEQYGCEYNYDPYATPTDTIPLFAQDDPGSSTVDPVDPNQVVATLQGNQLTIHENMGVDITYSLQHNTPAQTPAQKRAPQNDTFRNKVTVQITESGEYLLQLTNPSWDYTIFGRFTYIAEGIETVQTSAGNAQKELRNGQIVIRRGEKLYTVTGEQIE